MIKFGSSDQKIIVHHDAGNRLQQSAITNEPGKDVTLAGFQNFPEKTTLTAKLAAMVAMIKTIK